MPAMSSALPSAEPVDFKEFVRFTSDAMWGTAKRASLTRSICYAMILASMFGTLHVGAAGTACHARTGTLQTLKR